MQMQYIMMPYGASDAATVLLFLLQLQQKHSVQGKIKSIQFYNKNPNEKREFSFWQWPWIWGWIAFFDLNRKWAISREQDTFQFNPSQFMWILWTRWVSVQFNRMILSLKKSPFFIKVMAVSFQTTNKSNDGQKRRSF